MASSSCDPPVESSTVHPKHEAVSSRSESVSDVPDGWDVVEEEFVAADFSGVVENAILAPGSSLKVLDIDGPSPLIEVGGRALFRGTYNDVLGTLMFFKKENEQMLDYQGDVTLNTKGLNDPDETIPNAQEPSVLINKYGFVCKSSKVLKMERVFLKQREPDSQEEEGDYR